MAKTKTSKPYSSARKKTTASASKSARAKKATSKHSQTAVKLANNNNAERPAWLKKRDELTLKMFQMVYDDYQQGKFRRIQ